MAREDRREPQELMQPQVVTTTWFKHWAMRCWQCSREFHRFAVKLPVKCPYCRAANDPIFRGAL